MAKRLNFILYQYLLAASGDLCAWRCTRSYILSSAAKIVWAGEEAIGKISVLVALEEDYRAYRGVIAAAIRVLRPNVKASPSNWTR